MSSGLRVIEAATRALLGAHVELEFGPDLSGDGSRVIIPDRALPLRHLLLMALQASLVATQHLGSGGHSRWETTLVNLLVSRDLRRRFPGLGPVYLELEAQWHAQFATAHGAGDDPGGQLVWELLSLWVANEDSAPRPAALSSVAGVAAWAWLKDPTLPLPELEVPLARQPLPYQATQVLEQPPTALGKDLSTPASAGALLGSIRLPLSSATQILVVPPEQGFPSGAGAAMEQSGPGVTTSLPDLAETAACWHDEWDCELSRYRHSWCAVRETVAPRTGRPHPELDISAAAVRRVRRDFERNATRRAVRHRERDGVEVDLDQVVAAWAEDRTLSEERLFLAPAGRRDETAVAVLADLSESTFGWTLGLERVALLLLGEALQAVGDRFGLFGFRGRGRENCQVVTVKRFNEPFGPTVRRRIEELEAHGYTRIAPSFRHVGELLAQTGERRQILLLITDGMPYDTGGYGGAYAVEDTRKAFLELRSRGIRAYCLSVDFAANQYLSRMCGPTGWTLVNRRERLPGALLGLYRRVRL